MPISDKHFNDAMERINAKLDKLGERIDKLNERLSTIEGQSQSEREQKKHPLRIALFVILSGVLVTYFTWLGKQVVTLDTQVAGLLTPQKLQAAASNPTEPKNVSQVTKLLQDAQKRNQVIEPAVIAGVGAKFLEVSENNPNAWNAAISVLDYRSFLNKDFEPVLGQLTPIGPGSTYQPVFQLIPNDAGLKPGTKVLAANLMFTGGHTTDDKSARMEELDKPQSGSSGIAYFVLDGNHRDALSLDGMYMKNVVVRNSVVVYHGGPLRLENVYFVNCTFQLDSTKRTKAFGTTLLASAEVSFDGTAT
jgi:hypothetical protein